MCCFEFSPLFRGPLSSLIILGSGTWFDVGLLCCSCEPTESIAPALCSGTVPDTASDSCLWGQPADKVLVPLIHCGKGLPSPD